MTATAPAAALGASEDQADPDLKYLTHLIVSWSSKPLRSS